AGREGLDVRVVAVVQAARLAQKLVEVAHAGAVLAEVGGDEGERGPVLVRAVDGDGKAQGDGRGARLALDDLDPHARGDARLAETLRRSLARRKLREVCFHARAEVRMVASGEAGHAARLRLVVA